MVMKQARQSSLLYVFVRFFDLDRAQSLTMFTCVQATNQLKRTTQTWPASFADFIDKNEGFVIEWLVQHGLEKLVSIFKGVFVRFMSAHWL